MLKTNRIKGHNNASKQKPSNRLISIELQHLQEKYRGNISRKQLICCKIEECHSRQILIEKIQKQQALHKHIIRGIKTQIQEYSQLEINLSNKKEAICSEIIQIVHEYQIKQINLSILMPKIIQMYRQKDKELEDLRLELIQFQINHKNHQFGEKFNIRKCIIAFFTSIGCEHFEFQDGVELQICKSQKCMEFQFFVQEYAKEIAESSSELLSSVFMSHMKEYVQILKQIEKFFQQSSHVQKQQIIFDEQIGLRHINNFKQMRKQLKQFQQILKQKNTEEKLLDKQLNQLQQKIKIKKQLVQEQQKIKKQLNNKIKDLKIGKNVLEQYLQQLNEVNEALIYLKQKNSFNQNIENKQKIQKFCMMEKGLEDPHVQNEDRYNCNKFAFDKRIITSLKSNREQAQLFKGIDISEIRSSKEDIQNWNIMSLKSPIKESRRYRNRLGSPNPWK